MNQQLLSVEELSTKLNLPVSWIYSRTRRKGENQIPTVRCGKYCRFDYQTVLEWLQGLQAE
ncbi:MAG: helix-turn-helix domain-containing protein [Desulfobacterales bacterium]|nr:helix-turn-helix domain-containing protein [Desulfobacterales bacterium]